jgi:non-specific serine/threonine protein kinase
MPLAIELAAARVRVLSVEQIAARLGDAFRLLTGGSRTGVPRHRTLRATMEWSFGLLDESEQILLRRLGVFAGSFSLDAAERVCAGAPLDVDEILDGVTALVDKSLVVMTSSEGEARYHLLETVRQYALDKLRAAGEMEEMEEHHARWFLDLIEQSQPMLFGGENEPGLLARLARDNDNFRAAAAWSVREQGRAQVALRFAAAFFWYWYGSALALGGGQFREGKRFIASALERAAEVPCDPKLRGRALASAGLIALAQGDYRESADAFEPSLALLREHGDPADVIVVLAKYGATRLMLGELDAAWTMLEEAYESIKDATPDSVLHSFAYSWRGWIARARGDTKTAREMHEANLRVGRSVNHRTALGHGHSFLGACELVDGNVDAAFAQYCEALPYHLELGDGWGLALDFEGLAACAALRGRHADAARLIGMVDALRERSAVALPASDVADREQRVRLARTKLGDRYDAMYAEGRKLTMDEAIRVATDDSVIQTSEFRIPVPAKPRHGLRVETLGGLRVFVGDREIDTAAWGSARPRELLVYLLMHPEGRTKEQVGLAFWPDASTAQVRNNFHVTLHRLRKTLGGTEWVSLAGERYRIDPTMIGEVDVHAFEREMAAGDDERAVARYRGHFLDGEPIGDWHLEHRDRFQRMHVDALMRLGLRHMSDARHDEAANAFRRVLSHDELHEEALRSLMRALSAAGDRSEALRAFQRFSAKLRTELGAAPEAESALLADQLSSRS